MSERIVTYVGGLIALALVLKNGPQVSRIITQVAASTSQFSSVLLGAPR
jgi:hypothetical protein